MMSLQFLAIKTLTNSDVKYDKSDPVLQNVIFDINSALSKLHNRIFYLVRRIRNVRFQLDKRMTDFTTIKFPSLNEYDDIIDELSEILFDEFVYDIIETPEQVAWKEYFHGLYDLVVVPFHKDRTQYLMMIQESLKYFDILKPPIVDLNPHDKLYVKVRHCDDLFARLRREHEAIRVPKFFKKLKKHVELQTRSRIDYMKLNSELDKLKKERNDYNKILTCLE
jgi:hypothetical protein